MRYLSAEQVLFIHARLIDETGGSHGLRDAGLLQSAVARPRATFGEHDLYAEIFHKAAALLESLMRNHPFIDGNKRTAISSAAIFLRMNGLHLNVSQADIVRFSVDFATRKASYDDAVAWFKQHFRHAQELN